MHLRKKKKKKKKKGMTFINEAERGDTISVFLSARPDRHKTKLKGEPSRTRFVPFFYYFDDDCYELDRRTSSI